MLNGKQWLATILLASGVMASAHAGDLSCPKAATIKGAVDSLNGVIRQSEESYFVLSAQPAINESGLDWMIISQTQADGFDPAFAIGQTEVKSVVMPISDSPMQMEGVYVCGYLTSSGGMTVLAVAPQQSGGTVDPLKLKLNTIKFGK